MRRQSTATRDRLNAKRRALRAKLPKIRKGPSAQSLRRAATSARHKNYRRDDTLARRALWL